MITPDNDTIGAIRNLSNNKDFKQYIKWIKQNVENFTQELLVGDGTNLYRAQGKVFEFTAMLEIIEQCNLVSRVKKEDTTSLM